jgi:hypothetical protein
VTYDHLDIKTYPLTEVAEMVSAGRDDDRPHLAGANARARAAGFQNAVAIC